MEEKSKAWLEQEREQDHRLRASSWTLLTPTRPHTAQQSGAEQVKSSFVGYFGVVQAHR